MREETEATYYFDSPTEEEAKGFYRHVIRCRVDNRWIYRFRDIGRHEAMVLNTLNTRGIHA